jgi:esterase/lipase
MAEHVIDWHAAADCAPRGVALVVHGLNLKPREMGPLVRRLTAAQIDVIQPSLCGHGVNFRPLPDCSARRARLRTFTTVTHESWLHEIYASYLIARQHSERLDVPLFFVGFSLGGLLLCNLLIAHPDAAAHRMVLLSPALRVHPTSQLIRLTFATPSLYIPSLAPARYQANWVMTAAGYRATFDGIAYLERHGRRAQLNLPTLVLMNKWDELVSYRGIQRLIAEKGLDQWRLMTVNKGRDARVLINHPLFDPQAVGEAKWQRMMDEALAHLLDSPVPSAPCEGVLPARAPHA